MEGVLFSDKEVLKQAEKNEAKYLKEVFKNRSKEEDVEMEEKQVEVAGEDDELF